MAFSGLTKAPYASRYLSQFVALAPCFIGEVTSFFSDLDEELYSLLAAALNILGIESLFGPRWP